MPPTEDRHQIVPALEHLSYPGKDLSPFPGNARNGDTDAIGLSLATHGQYAPVVYQRSTGHIVKGNHVYHAALEAGWTHIAATALDVTDKAARALVLVDNRTSDLGRYDDGLLLDLLQSMDGDLLGTGFGEGDVLMLLDKIERQAQEVLDAEEGSRGLGDQPVVSYTLIFDTAEQQNLWYGYLKWLRSSGVAGDTIGARVCEHLLGIVPESIQ